jgi:ribose transport system substrate-binding protein
MNKLKFVAALVTSENDYQREQARELAQTADRLGAEVQVIYAENDAIEQGQQLLGIIQGPANRRPDAIICHPVGTGLTQVAQAAVSAGIGWAIINRDIDYIATLRGPERPPSFCISIDQKEVGHIQARQMIALLPKGGSVLYIQGPTGIFSSEQRTLGMQALKPENIQIRMLRGRFTEDSGYQAVNSWLRLSTSQQTPIDLVCSQNDNMAMGARRALEQEGGRWANLPLIGCDAVGELGQSRVRKGALAASIALPTTAGLALETFVSAYQREIQPPEHTVLKAESFPPEKEIAPIGATPKTGAKRP